MLTGRFWGSMASWRLLSVGIFLMFAPSEVIDSLACGGGGFSWQERAWGKAILKPGSRIAHQECQGKPRTHSNHLLSRMQKIIAGSSRASDNRNPQNHFGNAAACGLVALSQQCTHESRKFQAALFLLLVESQRKILPISRCLLYEKYFLRRSADVGFFSHCHKLTQLSEFHCPEYN